MIHFRPHCSRMQELIPKPVADPGFSRGGCANSQIGIILQILYRKLHENERIWTGGARPWRPPKIRQCKRTPDRTVQDPLPGHESSLYRDPLLVTSGDKDWRPVQLRAPRCWHLVSIEAATVGAKERYTSYRMLSWWTDFGLPSMWFGMTSML